MLREPWARAAPHYLKLCSEGGLTLQKLHEQPVLGQHRELGGSQDCSEQAVPTALV